MSEESDNQKPQEQEWDSRLEFEEDSQETPQEEAVEQVPEGSVLKTPVPKHQLQDLLHPIEKQGEFDPTKDLSVSLLNCTIPQFNELVESFPNLNAASGQMGENWVQAISSGRDHLMVGDLFADTLCTEDSEWTQRVDVDGKKLGIGSPVMKKKGGEISGEAALMRANSIMGLGAVVSVPLWNTGIWVTLKAPSDAALLELDRRISNEKVELGRQTHGLLFSNSSIYTTSYLVNFALNCVYDATVKDITPNALRRMIKITDIHTLLWGLVCTIYPNGYPYSQPCTANPAHCQHIMGAHLKLSRLQWVNHRALTLTQRRHMENRSAKMTTEAIQNYQREHTMGGEDSFLVQDQTRVHLRVPTIDEMETSGMAWVDGIVQMTDNAFGQSIKGEERNDYINSQARLTELRQFSHWFQEIELLTTEETISDRATIDVVLGSWSQASGISDEIVTAVDKFTNASTVSVIAIPRYNCPACGEPVGETLENHPHLIPIDISSVFFTLLDQRMYKALSKWQRTS